MNNEEYKIAVFYIATGDYKQLFPKFLDSLHNFFPKHKKIVKLISDGLEEFDNYKQGNVEVQLCPRINDYPWPVVALYKMWHIYQNFDESCELSCYFNGNAIVNSHREDIFDFNKITVSYHSFCSQKHPYNPWKYININKNSSAYLENETYEYIQSGFFFGPSNLIYKMCQDVIEMIRYDTRRFQFAQWHDESYLNKWCVLNKENVEKKYIMTIYQDEINKERFIYLRNKKDYSINRS